jgi:hypothetical protein
LKDVLALAACYRAIWSVTRHNNMWRYLYYQTFAPDMQVRESAFLDWCLRTVRRVAGKDLEYVTMPWPDLDWSDAYRRHVCTERNMRESRYIRRTFYGPRLDHPSDEDKWQGTRISIARFT